MKDESWDRSSEDMCNEKDYDTKVTSNQDGEYRTIWDLVIANERVMGAQMGRT